MTEKHVYLAGPMRGLPQFNFPSFVGAEIELLAKGGWTTIYSPAQHDVDQFGEEPFLASEDGSEESVSNIGFSVRDALADEMEWIARHATHMYMLRGWENSRGARAERALAIALDIEIIYQPPILDEYDQGGDVPMTPDEQAAYTRGYDAGWVDSSLGAD